MALFTKHYNLGTNLGSLEEDSLGTSTEIPQALHYLMRSVRDFQNGAPLTDSKEGRRPMTGLG